MSKSFFKSFTESKEVKNAGWLIVGKVAQMALSLVVSILTARYLGPGGYGLINYGMAFVGFFTAIASLGINSIIVKEFVDSPNEQGKTTGSAMLMRLCSGFLSALMIVGVSVILDHTEPKTILIVSLCGISLIFQAFETINYWFQSRYQSKVTAIITLIAYAVTSIYKIILLILGKDVLWFAIASSIDYIVLGVLLIIAYKKYNGEAMTFSLQKSKSLLKSSYHYILASMMVAIYGQTDKLMLKQMLDENTVAYYSTAVAICAMWVFILTAIIDSLCPTILKLYTVDKKAFERKNRQLYAIVFYMSVFVSTVFVLFGDFGIKFLYGEAYAPAGLPLKIVTWYTAFSYLGVARNVWIVSERKQKYLKYIYCIAALMNVMLNVIFIPLWGASGAAVASLVTQICTSIVLPFFIKDLRPNAKLMLEAIILKDVFDKKTTKA